MNNEDRIQKEVDRTLKSLDGLDRASVDEYFFTRLEARMENEPGDSTGISGLSWSIAAVMVILFINTITLLYFSGIEDYRGDISEQEITALTKEYALIVPSLYEQEINE